MATEITEIIDLTGSPTPSPPPPRSSVAPTMLDFGSGSGPVMPSWANNFNPNLRYANLQQTLWQASGQTYHPSQMTAATFQPTMHGAQQIATVLEPVPDSNAVLFPNGTRFREPWTPKEHELFLMGLIKYGRGRWSKISRHFLWNKTPQQVQSYAASFFRHLPETYMYSFRRRNTTQPAAANTITTTRNVNNRNLIVGSTSYSMPMVNANEPQAPQTLMLFPENPPLFPVAPCVEAGSSSNAITTYWYGYQMETGASTSITASGNGGEIDLELRLGYSWGDDS